MTLKNPFASAIDKYGTRHYGSSIKTFAAEPYTTGTFYIWLILPKTLVSNIKTEIGLSELEIQKLLSACCTGVTPPGGTVNKIEFTGIGGVKWSVPGSIDYGTSISLKFIEYQTTPILDFFSAWVRYMRSQLTGISEIAADSYLQENYSGVLYYFTATPNSENIQYYCAYDGIFPLKDPGDLFASDIETIDKQEIEIEFNVNRQVRTADIKEECKKRLEQVRSNHKKMVTFTGGDTNPT